MKPKRSQPPQHTYRCRSCGSTFTAEEQARFCPLCGRQEVALQRSNSLGQGDAVRRPKVDLSSPEAVLHAADGDPSVVRAALEEGIDPNCCTDAYSLLHLAVREGDPELIRRLVEQGADVNCSNNLEETPLHWAVYNGRREAVELLYDLGADPSVRDADGLYPADMVEEMRADIDNLYESNEAERERAVASIEAMADLVARLGFPRG